MSLCCRPCCMLVVPMIALGTVLFQGCASHSKPKTETPAKTTASAQGNAAAAVNQGRGYVMMSHGTPVLRLVAPGDAPCEVGDGTFDMKSREGYVNVWLVPGASTVQDGVQKIPSVIAGEFKDFSAEKTTDFAGAMPGKRVFGSGREADDNDPGTADVIVFQAGGRVFIACTHGESLRASAQQRMVELVRTVSLP